MKRTFNENPTRTTAGCLPVQLFNQKKRNRLPLTSNPIEKEFHSSNEYSSARGFESSYRPSGFSQTHAPSNQVGTAQASQWANQGYQSVMSNASSSGGGFAPMAHPGRARNTGSNMGQQSFSSGNWQETKQRSFPSTSGNAQSKVNTASTYRQADIQESFHRQQNQSEPVHQSPKLQWPKSSTSSSSTTGVQSQSSSWKFKSTPQISQFKEDNQSWFPNNGFEVPQPKKPPVFKMKPAEEKSLRLVTTVLAGMKHWSQYSDRAPFLFEVSATLDSAVTTGSHGAKTFLLRDGLDAVQCVFYETDRELPRLIRGQVHRCVGNYDKKRNQLKCVSVRPATTLEQRNFPESVKASDMEMRQYIKMLNEV
ncbi:spermatogenesis-associated protein 22-like [Acipenser oxyrinchus oxyrinchus]|uniref:Spermatogenesis-associated protein 22-like n=1 Tax=Acipenser oxyrinchus oxyrinchus TaxID=40147 RepID=A0AAD8CFD1_ACIOX|nr:spermatogenesis-associated protein 22-like [Acipenser oxyrinchus oxyrinchus]